MFMPLVMIIFSCFVCKIKEQLLTHVLYTKFKEACGAFGLLKDDTQWHVAMLETAVHSMPHQLRDFFSYVKQ